MSIARTPPSPPDTLTARAAADLAALACSPALLGHSHRTYLLGAILVTEDLDHEAAYVAAMVHDLGLTDRHRGAASFERVGADLAARFLEGHGWPADRVRLVARAIERHVEPVVHDDPTMRLVQAGATLDVAALPQRAVTDPAVLEVLTRHPRGAVAQELREVFLDEVARHPDGGFAVLQDRFSFADAIGRHPWDAT